MCIICFCPRAQKSLAPSSLARVPVITDHLYKKYMYVEKIVCVNDICHSLPAHVSADRSGNGAEKAENRVSGNGAVSEHSKNAWLEAKRGEGDHRAGAEGIAGVTTIGLNAELQIGRSRSAQMLCWLQPNICVIMCDTVHDWHLVVFTGWHSYEDSGFVVIDITGVGVLDVEVGAGAITCAVAGTVL